MPSKKIECFVLERPGAGDVGFGFGSARFGAGVAEEEPDEQDVGEDIGEVCLMNASETVGWKVIV